MGHFNVPQIIGATFRRDHIFWPTLSASQTLAKQDQGEMFFPAKTAHRPECTVKQMMAVVGRVKEWSFSGAWSATASYLGGGFVPVVSSTFDNSPPLIMQTATVFPEENYLIRHPVTEELKLSSQYPLSSGQVSPRYIADFFRPLRNLGFISSIPISPQNATNSRKSWTYKMAKVSDYVPGSGPGISNVFLLVSEHYNFDGIIVSSSVGSRALGVDLVVYEGTKFYPFFYFNDGVEVGAGTVGCITSFDSQPNQGVFTIDPVVAPSFTAPLLFTASNGGTVTAFNSTMKITASKFFTYKNRLGQPVYNETTGAQINDPFGGNHS